MRILKQLPPLRPAISAFRQVFSPLTLGDFECLELLCPELQARSRRRDYFENLKQIGPPLLDIFLNENLGTQNAHVSSELLQQFVAKHNLEQMLLATSPALVTPQLAAQLVPNTLASIYLESGPQVAERIAQKIFSGPSGLATMYIYSW